jgi:hypothetical protein
MGSEWKLKLGAVAAYFRRGAASYLTTGAASYFTTGAATFATGWLTCTDVVVE